jgi:hypothetical protein
MRSIQRIQRLFIDLPAFIRAGLRQKEILKRTVAGNKDGKLAVEKAAGVLGWNRGFVRRKDKCVLFGLLQFGR